MSSHSTMILTMLRKANGEIVCTDRIVDAVYGHRIDGGPFHAVDCVRQGVLFLRRRGYSIEHVIGYRVASRASVELTARQRELVEAIRSSDAETELTSIAATIGMTRGTASCLLHGARARGIVVERMSGYRLRETPAADRRLAA